MPNFSFLAGSLLALLSLGFALEVPTKGFELEVSRKFYSKKFPELKLACNKTEWNDKDKIVVFYTGKTVIYDSSSHQNFPMVAETSNKTVVLRENYTTGWLDLSCAINKVPSTNVVTVPYIGAINLTHASTSTLTLGQTYSLGCEGYVLPVTPLGVRFSLNSKAIAVIVLGQLMKGNITGLEVEDTIVGNNTIRFKPTLKANGGRFACSLDFSIPHSSANISRSTVWKALTVAPTVGPSPGPKGGALSTETSAAIILGLLSTVLLLIS